MRTPLDRLIGFFVLLHFAGRVETIAGRYHAGKRDGIGSEAQFEAPNGVAADGRGTVWIADRCNHLIRSIDRKTRTVTTISGMVAAVNIDGIGTDASFSQPRSIAYSQSENALYIGCEGAIRRLNLNTKEVTTIKVTTIDDMRVWGIAVLSNGMLVFSCAFNHSVYSVHPDSGHTIRLAGSGAEGTAIGEGSKAEFKRPSGIAVDELSGRIYVCEDGHRICCISILTEF